MLSCVLSVGRGFTVIGAARRSLTSDGGDCIGRVNFANDAVVGVGNVDVPCRVGYRTIGSIQRGLGGATSDAVAAVAGKARTGHERQLSRAAHFEDTVVAVDDVGVVRAVH